MKKLLILTLIALAAWQAYIHLPGLLQRHGQHEAVIHNRSGRGIERLRLTVDHQTLVREKIDTGTDATFHFSVGHDSPFDLTWQWSDAPNESHWQGGFVPKGSMLERHDFSIDGDGGVIYETSRLMQPS